MTEHQGPWSSGGDTAALEELSLRQEGGESYRELAGNLNGTVGRLLRDHLRFEADYTEASPHFRTWGDYHRWLGEYLSKDDNANPYSLDHARDLLLLVGLSRADADNALREAQERLAAGEAHFRNDWPVSASKLRAKLRHWREGSKHKLLQREQAAAQALRHS